MASDSLPATAQSESSDAVTHQGIHVTSEGEVSVYGLNRIQYTTDAPHWGGLSGCTFEEAISWGKEDPRCPRVQCFCDATIALPLVTSALITRREKWKGKRKTRK